MFRKELTVAALVVLMTSASHGDLIDGEELVDPTRPLLASVEVGENRGTDVLNMIRNVLPSSYDVSFIRASSTNPIAVVNSERVTIGDNIGGASVVAIDRTSVTLSINGEERRISLYGDSIKRPAAQ